MNAIPSLWAVVPVKPFAQAKTRLAPVLAPAGRALLARAMLEDVLAALAASPALAGILVVTGDADAEAIARLAGAEVLADRLNDGITAAVAAAARHLALAGCGGMLVVPADLPLLTPEDVELVARAHRGSPAVTMVAASNDGGTNALACSPPDAMAFSYGNGSFRRHWNEAESRGIAPRLLRLPRFGLDIDRPEDLAAFMTTPTLTRSYAFLSENLHTDGAGRACGQALTQKGTSR
ncbi:MAG: 2-phospho-L-lactate guanylyltransferase [Noviherbaspirillum sp.]